MARVTFPPGFLWGAATASYQIEGSPLADGAGASIWHEWAHTPGKIIDGSNADEACDHYRLWREDIRLMRELGLNAYRFSVSWPRTFPEPGRVNRAGLDFYSRLVDGLREAGIEPWVTIFHWDEPLWCERAGGFAARETVDHLVEYGTLLFRELGDRVKRWITINEPSAYASIGYVLGHFPPGHRMDLRGMYHASHHLMLGHALLFQACHAECADASVGIALAQAAYMPAHPGRRRDRRAAAFMDAALNRFYRDPLFFGRYPPEVTAAAHRYLPRGYEKDVEAMKGSADFLGINYYSRTVIRHSLLQPYTHAKEHIDPRAPRSAMWEIYPEGIHDLLLELRDRYGNPPCYVTENGFPLPTPDGVDPLDDEKRIAYLNDHIGRVGTAVAEGVDCRGYFHWTLMDNFEWAYGYTMPFGLMRTDFATQERQWRKSAFWYQALIRRGWLEVSSWSI
jgi:beta-glucosidase